MLTKKRLAGLTVLMSVMYFLLLLFLPESVVGSRSENMLLFAPKLGFLAITAAITTAMVLILAFKRDFVRWQMQSFNRFKYLLFNLVKRDFVSRYRKSVLGVLWSLLNPLLTMLVMTIVFSQLFRFAIPYYPVYLLSGQIVFSFFSEATNRAMGSVINAEGIIKKVYVPKYIFPLSNVLSSLVNLLFLFIAFLLVFLFHVIFLGAPFYWTIFLIPIPFLYVFVFALGIGMLMSSLSVFFRDLTYLYGILITLLMYLTPIFYPIDIIPERLMPFMGLNPMYQFVTYFRSLVLDGVIPGLWPNAVCAGFALAALCIGTYVFISKQDRYILYL
jgi:ABC-type polysaccharide/polyol phosphate export permease